MQADSIRETGRNAKGVRVMDMRDGDKIIAVEPLMAEDSVPDEEQSDSPEVSGENQAQ